MNKWIKFLYKPSQCKSPVNYNSKTFFNKREKNCWLCSCLALGTWAGVTSLESEQAWVPRRDCPGLRALGRVCQANSPPPHGLGLPVPLCISPQSPDPGDPPAAEPALAPPKDGGVSGLEELCKVLWAPCLLVAGFPPPASFLRVTPLRGQLLLQSSVAIVEICRGIKAQREGRKETQPRVYPFLLTTQNRICPKALVGMKKCCHLVAAFGNINWKTCADGHLVIFTRPART